MYFAMKFLKSKTFAEDIFQDAFLSVWENRRFIRPDAPFAPYIYTIVKNRILNLLAGIDKEEYLKKTILANAIDYHNGTDNALLDADFDALLENMQSALTPQQRRVFDMSRKEMKTHKEIADELHISVYTVQQHISASLKVIRTCLVKYAGDSADILLLLLCLNMQ
jgi:RNA polymerase sigma-70 factor (ECF subfamily)